MLFQYLFGIFRAIDINVLIGNIGGYVGLLLGFSILQAPDLLMQLFGTWKRFYKNLSTGSSVEALQIVPIVSAPQSKFAIFEKPNKKSIPHKDDIATIVCRLDRIEKLLSEKL